MEDEAPIKKSDRYKVNRILYIIEAAVEYFIVALAGGAYLAKITTSIGIPDDVTAILTSTVSLGVGFQLFALFISRNKKVKKIVTPWAVIYQLMLTMIYFVPVFDLSREVKTVLLFMLLIVGQAIQNVIAPCQTRWLMSSVSEDKRGSFTAIKEIVSLISGMIFFNIVGAIIDAFEADGNITGAFITLGIVVFLLTLTHTLLLVFTKEDDVLNQSNKKEEPILAQIKDVVCDKNLWKVLPVQIIWSVAVHISTPFYGTFQIKDLGFSMVMVTVLSAISSIMRAVFSLPFGKYADHHSYAQLLNICYPLAAAGFLLNVFSNSFTGIYLYSGYTVLYMISLAGINGSNINLIYDAVPYKKRVGALAIRGALTGFLGFFATLAVRPLVQHIQSNNNTFLGMNVYAQQVLSAISCVLIVIIIIYLNTVLRGFKRIYERL